MGQRRLEDLVPGGGEGRLLQRGARAPLHVALGRAPTPLRLRYLEARGDLPDLLVLQETPDQLRPGIQLVLVPVAREEHLRLDPHQGGGHLQEFPGAVELGRLDGLHRLEELVGDLGDGDVEDVDVLHPDQVQEEVQGALEPIDVDDPEAVLLGEGAGQPGGPRHQAHIRRRPSAHPMSQVTG